MTEADSVSKVAYQAGFDDLLHFSGSSEEELGKIRWREMNPCVVRAWFKHFLYTKGLSTDSPWS